MALNMSSKPWVEQGSGYLDTPNSFYFFKPYASTNYSAECIMYEHVNGHFAVANIGNTSDIYRPKTTSMHITNRDRDNVAYSGVHCKVRFEQYAPY